MSRVLAVVVLSALIFVCSAGQKRWIGGSSSWANPAAWDPFGVPDPSDDITINAGDVSLNGVVVIGSHLAWTGGSLRSGVLEISAAATVDIAGDEEKQLFQIVVSNGGICRLKDTGRLTCLFTGYNQSILITNRSGAVFELAGTAEIAQGNNSGWPAELQFVNEGTLRKTGTTTTGLEMLPFHNRGTVEIQAGSLRISGGGTSPGLFTVAEAASVDLRTGAFNFADAHWEGLGPVRIQNTMRLEGAFSATNFGLAEGELSGDFDVSGRFEWTGGHLVSARARLGAGKHRITGHADKYLFNSTLANAGDLEVATAEVGFRFSGYNQGAAFTNETTGTVTLSGEANFALHNPGGWPPVLLAFVNEGSLRSTGGSTNAVLDLPLHNHGLIEVKQGTFQQRGGGNSTGRWAVAHNAAAHWLGGNYHCTSVIMQGPGPVHVFGNVRVDGILEAANLVFGGGTLSGDCTISGGFHWAGGRLSGMALRLGVGQHSLTGEAGLTMQNSWVANAGVLQVDGTKLALEFTGYNQSAALTNLESGTIELRNQSSVEQRNPSGWPPTLLSFVNQGTLHATGFPTNAVLDIPLHNHGQIAVTDGVFHQRGGGISTGRWILAEGATAGWLGGNYTVNDAVQRGPGALVVTGGTQLTGNFDAENLVLAGGTMSGDCDLTGGFHWTGGKLGSAAIRLGAGEHTISDNAGHIMQNTALSNSGHLMITGAKLALEFTGYSQFATITNSASGTLELLGGAVIEQRNSGGWPPVLLQLVNDGELRSSGPSTNALVSLPFHNRGRVVVQSGVLAHTGGGISPGEFRVAADAGYAFSIGVFDYGSSHWYGPGPANITGNATILGGFDAEHFVLAAGEQSGECVIRGGWQWTGGNLANATLRLGTGAHHISGANEKNMSNSTLENSGHLTINGGTVGMLLTGYSQSVVVRNTATGLIDLSGDWRLQQRNPSGWPPVAFGLISDGRLRKVDAGTTVLDAVPLISNGMCEVESGTLQVVGNAAFGAAGQLILATGGGIPLLVSGNATLAGTVGSRTGIGANPTEGAEYPVIEAGNIVGAFANNVAINPGHAFAYEVRYGPKSIIFTARSVLPEPVQMTSPSLAGGSLQCAINAPAGLIVQIESSTDLVNWHSEASTTVTSTPLTWEDTDAAIESARFYRVSLLP